MLEDRRKTLGHPIIVAVQCIPGGSEMAPPQARRAARWRLPVAAALIGACAAWAAWAWPASPLWRSGPEVGLVEGFSPDGQVVVATRVPQSADGIHFPDPEVCRWDAATGAVLSRTRFVCDARSAKAAQPS